MIISNMYEAKTRLSQLVQKALEGEEVILAKFGKPLVRLVPTNQYAAAGFAKPWQAPAGKKSSAYTTKWRDLPVVKAYWPDSLLPDL